MEKTILEKLEAARTSKIRAKEYRDKIEEIKTLLERCTPSYEPRVGSGTQPYNDDNKAKRIDKLVQLREALIYLECEAVDDVMDCYAAMKALPDTQRTVLELYYLSGKCRTWDDVAMEVGYSVDHCKRIAGEAKNIWNPKAPSSFPPN